MTKRKVARILRWIKIYYSGKDGLEEVDTYIQQGGCLDYSIDNRDLFVSRDGETIAIYTKGYWKRIYPEWTDENLEIL